jgi:hypothetical protein
MGHLGSLSLASMLVISLLCVASVSLAAPAGALNMELPFTLGIISDRYGDVVGKMRLQRSAVFEEHLSGTVVVSKKPSTEDASAEGSDSEEFARVVVEQSTGGAEDCGSVRIFRASQTEADDDNVKPYASFSYCFNAVVNDRPTATGPYVGEGKSKGHFNFQIISKNEFRLQLLDAFYANQTMVHGYAVPTEAPPSQPWYNRLGVVLPVAVMFLLKSWLEAMRNKQDRKKQAAASLAAKKSS